MPPCAADSSRAIGSASGSGHDARTVAWQPTFGAVSPDELLLYDDADYAGLAIGVNQGSAAERLGLTLDTPVRIEPA